MSLVSWLKQMFKGPASATMPRIEELNDAERQMVASGMDSARQMVLDFSPDDSGKQLDASILDRTYAGWLATKESDVNRINQVINAIGFAFGQLLVDDSGFRFVVATDARGCEMAILALPGKGDVLVYPTHLVAKRWQTRETDFLVPLYRVITDQVRDAVANWPNLPDAFRKE